MKATVYFLVRVDQGYNNEIEMANGKKLAVNNSIDSVKHINRVGEVVSAPSGSNAKKGDQVLFHHNICRQSWDRKRRRSSHFLITDNTYYIPATEIFLIKRGGSGQWEAIDPYVFLRPIEAKYKTLSNGLKVMEDSYKNMKDLTGVVSFPSQALLRAGISPGDTVAFQEDSEYEFEIDGQVHYRMRTNDILAVYEGPI